MLQGGHEKVNGQTDRQTDRRTERQAESNIPPLTSLRGLYKSDVERRKTLGRLRLIRPNPNLQYYTPTPTPKLKCHLPSVCWPTVGSRSTFSAAQPLKAFKSMTRSLSSLSAQLNLKDPWRAHYLHFLHNSTSQPQRSMTRSISRHSAVCTTQTLKSMTLSVPSNPWCTHWSRHSALLKL